MMLQFQRNLQKSNVDNAVQNSSFVSLFSSKLALYEYIYFVNYLTSVYTPLFSVITWRFDYPRHEFFIVIFRNIRFMMIICFYVLFCLDYCRQYHKWAKWKPQPLTNLKLKKTDFHMKVFIYKNLTCCQIHSNRFRTTSIGERNFNSNGFKEIDEKSIQMCQESFKGKDKWSQTRCQGIHCDKKTPNLI